MSYEDNVQRFTYQGSLENSPDWVVFAYQVGTLFFDLNGKLFLKILGGSIPVEVGDCIVKDPNGIISTIKSNGGITNEIFRGQKKLV